jgi:putative heme iron utilization protein
MNKQNVLHTIMGRPSGQEEFEPVREARKVLRSAATGSLATIDQNGYPFASLVTVATTASGEPLMLLSDIAVHAKNLKRDDRASLLLVAPGGESGDPLAGARMTVTGRVVRDDEPDHRRRFLARHEEGIGYADFKDFNFYRLAVETTHLVAGFGRIVSVKRDDLLIDLAGREAVMAGEEGAVTHMNEDHADAIHVYATRLLGLPAAQWKMTGFDLEGLDLRAGALRGRLEFPEPLKAPGDLRRILVDLAKRAREAA